MLAVKPTICFCLFLDLLGRLIVNWLDDAKYRINILNTLKHLISPNVEKSITSSYIHISILKSQFAAILGRSSPEPNVAKQSSKETWTFNMSVKSPMTLLKHQPCIFSFSTNQDLLSISESVDKVWRGICWLFEKKVQAFLVVPILHTKSLSFGNPYSSA